MVFNFSFVIKLNLDNFYPIIMAIRAQFWLVYFWPLVLMSFKGSFILRLECCLSPGLEVVPPLPELIPRTLRPRGGQPPEVWGQLRGDQQLPLRPQIVNSPPTLRPAPRKCSASYRNERRRLRTCTYYPYLDASVPWWKSMEILFLIGLLSCSGTLLKMK